MDPKGTGYEYMNWIQLT